MGAKQDSALFWVTIERKKALHRRNTAIQMYNKHQDRYGDKNKTRLFSAYSWAELTKMMPLNSILPDGYKVEYLQEGCRIKLGRKVIFEPEHVQQTEALALCLLWFAKRDILDVRKTY